MSFLIGLLSLIVVIGVLVFVHELGHFLAAKASGIHVHRFSLGLGSPIKALTVLRGGTEYSISWLPLGGYVKMASKEEDSASSVLEGGAASASVPRERVFESKPVWVRMIVILAGVTMNALFAWATYSYLAAKNGRQTEPITTVGRVVEELIPRGGDALRSLKAGDRIVAVGGKPVHSWEDVQKGIATSSGDQVSIRIADGREVVLPIHADALEERLSAAQAIEPLLPPVIGSISPGRPAEKAGLVAGDTVLTVNGKAVSQWRELVEVIQASPGVELTLEVQRNGERRIVRVTPAEEMLSLADGKAQKIGRIGVTPAREFRYERYNLGQAIVAGWKATIEASTQIVRTVRGMFTGRVSTRDVGGPILIGQLAGQSVRLGLDRFLAFMALISVNLAILNMLPIPALDGGQFLFLLAEALIRRPLPLKLRERLTAVGLVLILMLVVLAFSNDIRRLLGM